MDEESCPVWRTGIFQGYFFSTFNDIAGTKLCIGCLCDQFRPGDGCNTWKRLSTKSQRRDVRQVFHCLNLACKWRRKARCTSSCGMPQPLSVIRMKEMPPSLISIFTEVDPASIAFSTSSFTIDAGRSITSPAAILSIVIWSNTWIVAYFRLSFYQRFFSLFCNR